MRPVVTIDSSTRQPHGDLPSRLAAVRERLRRAEAAAGRPVGSVRLLAVSKKHPPAAIRAVAGCGQLAFGENYVDEALAKQPGLTDLPLSWHYIGPIQSNKTRAIATHFAWVQSVDRLKVLRRLAEQRPAELPPLACLIQVRIGSEASKSGADPALVEALADAGAGLDGIQLRGLMSIPPPERDFGMQRRWCAQLRELYERLDPGDRGWDTLSMGMSADLEAAIAEGSTMVRVGTDIFGPRPA